jgi:cation diffusion facilitator CzcD-associated flavoprotein CzcO
MTNSTDVAIIGAGPYGLSLAAHLREAGVPYRQFGVPMNLWRTAMPRGMYLKSQGFASNLSDPKQAMTLEAFCAATGRAYGRYGVPVPLDTFVEYGRWFQEQLSQPVEESLVTSLNRAGEGFRVTVDGGEQLTARAVVLAVGVEHFAYQPAPFAGLPRALCTHSSALTDPSAFAGRSVIVVGAGQSALESAALLHENGADVQVLARRPRLAWNGKPLSPDRPFLRQLREPEAGLGSGWATWFYSDCPDIFRGLPAATRLHRARTALGPAGAWWLRPRVEGEFPVHTGHLVTGAEAEGGRVRMTVTADGASGELTADHVIAATGYRAALGRLAFVGDDIRSSARTLGGTPLVSRGYQSSIAGLYVIGPLVAPSLGPVMRFVYGTRHAALAVSRQLAGLPGRPAADLAASR